MPVLQLSGGRTSAFSARATCGSPMPIQPRTSSRPSIAWATSSPAARRPDEAGESRNFPKMTYLWIAIGSAIGGIARHWCTMVATAWLGATFPWGTLFINVLGSFVIGLFFILTDTDGRYDVSANAKVFVMVGICGGYTTFSAFSLQTLGLALEGQWLRAGAYVLASVVLCLIAVWAGYAVAAAVNAAGPAV